MYGVLPFFHAFGLTFCLNLPGQIGATLVMFPNFDPAEVLKAVDPRPATFMAGVAPMFDLIATAAQAMPRPPYAGLRQIRLAFAGAMPIPAETVERWESLTGGLLIEGYGMTECAPVALGNPCAPTRRPGTLGVPFPNTDIRIVDIDDPTVVVEPDSDGVRRGELLVRGPQVFLGYWNRPEETADQLLPGGVAPYGYLVEVDATGWVTPRGPGQGDDHRRRLQGLPVSRWRTTSVRCAGVADVAVVGLPASGGDERVARGVRPRARRHRSRRWRRCGPTPSSASPATRSRVPSTSSRSYRGPRSAR